ncbi:MAG: DUF2141 domain-containing protein [Hyphomicrobiales bacterium]|nr:DUF2141 domain-containing protein [Hyphomicrobiales bacterium]
MKLRATIGIAATCAASTITPAKSADLTVNIIGINRTQGEVCCALYPQGQEFLASTSAIDASCVKASDRIVQCRFTDIQGGAYAIGAFHDYNGNKTNDTNLLGIPTEPWGVSNNARPMFRAPTFEEAQISVADGAPLEIDVRLELTLP